MATSSTAFLDAIAALRAVRRIAVYTSSTNLPAVMLSCAAAITAWAALALKDSASATRAASTSAPTGVSTARTAEHVRETLIYLQTKR